MGAVSGARHSVAVGDAIRAAKKAFSRIVRACVARLLSHRRAGVAQLPENGILTFRWPGGFALMGARSLAVPGCVFFIMPVGYRQTALACTFFLFAVNPMGC